MTNPMLIAPHLRPSSADLARALLYSEKVYTLVPSGYEPRGLFAELEQGDLWEGLPIEESLLSEMGEDRARLLEECIHYAQRSAGQLRPLSGVEQTAMRGKLPDILEAELINAGALRESDQPEVLESTVPNLIPVLLSVLGRELAERKSARLALTSKQSVLDALRVLEDNADVPESASGQLEAHALTFASLPQPDESRLETQTGLRELIDFRMGNQAALRAMWNALDKLTSAQDSARDNAMRLKDACRELEARAIEANAPVLTQFTDQVRSRGNQISLITAALGGMTTGAVLEAALASGIQLVVQTVFARVVPKEAVFLKRAHAHGLMRNSQEQHPARTTPAVARV